jgi:hypothetical protein
LPAFGGIGNRSQEGLFYGAVAKLKRTVSAKRAVRLVEHAGPVDHQLRHQLVMRPEDLAGFNEHPGQLVLHGPGPDVRLDAADRGAAIYGRSPGHDWNAAMIEVFLAIFALWMRFEHRMTALETRITIREEQEDRKAGIIRRHEA